VHLFIEGCIITKTIVFKLCLIVYMVDSFRGDLFCFVELRDR